MEKIEIYGKVFELSNKPVENIHLISNKSLYDCYITPSKAKVSIFTEWCEYFVFKLHTYDFGVLSYNLQFFTLECMFTYMGTRYYAKITPSHNYLYKRIYT